MRIDRLISESAARLRESSESARLDVELLLAHALGKSRAWLYAHGDDKLAGPDQHLFEDLLHRRLSGEPVAYLTGEKEFWSLSLQVSEATLVPRPETERLVELALQQIPTGKACRVADLGTGSGAIALAIASERPECSVVATDISTDALEIARINSNRIGTTNIEFIESDWTAALTGQLFDLVVSNPPYIEENDSHLAALHAEPASALVSGKDGLDDIRRLAADVPAVLMDDGLLILEHGAIQGEAVSQVLEDAGWRDIECHQDYGARARATSARRP